MYSMPVTTTGDLGVALQQARLVQERSQRDLASAIGVSQRYIWELESGKDTPALTRLLAAFAELGVTVEVNIPEDSSHG